ncbi:MAG: carbohydrate-binding protein, partial [Fidelibacterota bacterium]
MTGISVLIILITSLSWSQVVYWEPDQPWQGGEISIYYDVIAGTLPEGTTQVIIHLGTNGWQNVNDYNMDYTGDAGWWRFDWTIPFDVTVLDFAFTDGQGNWDNNGGYGVDWHIAVIEAGLWTPLVPNPNDTVTVLVNNPVGGNLWWGVNSWEEPLQSYWPPGTVLGDPGASVESPLNGPDENGDNWIRVGPFTSGQQPVEVLDFVFHWNDGTWDNNNFNDYHILYDFTPQDGDATVEILSH